MNQVASIKDRLKNLSRENGKTMQELFTAYALERTIYRLSVSRYVSNFTLKGGIFLYAIFDGNYARATTDIDLLAEKISNDLDDLKKVFAEIFSLDANDPLVFDTNSLQIRAITEFKQYHGANISIMSFLDRTRIPVSIDIGFGDVVYPERVEMNFPVVLSDESPRIYAYSLASSVAEKFEAIVSLAYDNSRFKDFYDLYVIATKYDFDGEVLKEAVRETFANRHTPLSEIVAFEPGFVEETVRKTRWNAFVRKKKAILPISLEDTIQLIERFMMPIVTSIQRDEKPDGYWNHKNQCWQNEHQER